MNILRCDLVHAKKVAKCYIILLSQLSYTYRLIHFSDLLFTYSLIQIFPLTAQFYETFTAQKMKFSNKDFFSKCDQIRSFLRICSHLLKKSVMENFIFCEVLGRHDRLTYERYYKRCVLSL